MALQGIHHIGILVDDLAQAQAFAADVLGLSEVSRLSIPEEDTEICFFDCGGVRLELIAIGDPEVRAQRGRTAGAAPEIDHIAFSVDDIDAEATRIRGHGVQFGASPTDTEDAAAPLELAGGRSLFSLRDSSGGIVWQLLEEVE